MQCLSRRHFLAASSALLAARLPSRLFAADTRPTDSGPRAIDGDNVREPDWDEKLTITVGPKRGDLVGSDDKVVQAAVDYVARLGGGTVQVLPGTFQFRNAVHLPSGIRLLGSGDDSILTKIASESVPLGDDSDWYDREITLKGKHGFRVGDGVLLKAKNANDDSQIVIKRMLVAGSGNRFKLSDGLRKNLWLSGKPTCSSLFPLLTSERTADVFIENITLDGNRKNNENLNGNYGGCIFLQDCNRYTIRGVTTRNYNGDGVSFQICHDVVVENCHSHDNADLGVHPGSGSQRPRLLGNRLERNGIGIFWCWGVRYGLAEKNKIDANRNYGISIGHRDTDNVMRDNDVTNSGKVGVLFRNDGRGRDFWANRNVIDNNRIVNSGGESGIGIDIQGQTKDIRIVGNSIRETRKPMNRTGVRIAAEAGTIQLIENAIEGFQTAVIDARKAT
jgi:hypothetical protein